MNQLATTNRRVDLSKLPLRLGAIALILSITAVFALSLIATIESDLSSGAVVVAYAACLAGALIGHILSQYPTGNQWIMVRLIASMLVRVGFPLAAALVCRFFVTSIFSPGFIYLVILFYLVALISEAVLSFIRLKHC